MWYLSFSVWLHLVWWSLGASMLLQMALFHYLKKINYFWVCWVFLALCELFLVAESLDYSSLWYMGFLLLWPLLLPSIGSRLVSLASCGAQALLLRGMWSLSSPGTEPMSPALSGGFLSTAPPGRSFYSFLKLIFIYVLIPHLLYPSICHWTFRLLPCLESYK